MVFCSSFGIRFMFREELCHHGILDLFAGLFVLLGFDYHNNENTTQILLHYFY